MMSKAWPTRVGGAALVLAGAGLGLGLGLALAGPSAGSAAVLTAARRAGPTGAAPGARVSVVGTAEVTGTPDTMTLQIGASTSAASASAALERNNAEVEALEAALESAGVQKTDMQTASLSLGPTYDSAGNVDGYQASDELTVTLHGLARAGSVIDAAAHAVGNDVQIDGISFSISSTSSLLAAAREGAVRDAEQKASELAAAAGAKLGPVVSITDEESQPPPVFLPFGSAAVVRGTPDVPVQPGSQQLSVQVHAVFSLAG